MRQEIIDYLGTLNLGSFTLSQEMPWISSDQPLYQKNLKKIYVDKTQFSTEFHMKFRQFLGVANTSKL